jgi:hypothetical protein
MASRICSAGGNALAPGVRAFALVEVGDSLAVDVVLSREEAFEALADARPTHCVGQSATLKSGRNGTSSWTLKGRLRHNCLGEIEDSLRRSGALTLG